MSVAVKVKHKLGISSYHLNFNLKPPLLNVVLVNRHSSKHRSLFFRNNPPLFFIPWPDFRRQWSESMVWFRTAGWKRKCSEPSLQPAPFNLFWDALNLRNCRNKWRSFGWFVGWNDWRAVSEGYIGSSGLDGRWTVEAPTWHTRREKRVKRGGRLVDTSHFLNSRAF